MKTLREVFEAGAAPGGWNFERLPKEDRFGPDQYKDNNLENNWAWFKRGAQYNTDYANALETVVANLIADKFK